MGPSSNAQYALGWQHGYAAASQGEALSAPAIPEPSKTTKWLAAGTLVAGLGGAAAAVLYRTDSPYRNLAVVAGVSGLILSSVVTSLRVLQGSPTPRLGLQA